jgi:predicted transcriptional regulator
MPGDNKTNDQLVLIFKALSDSNRLKIVGLLARQPYSVEQLAALLDLKPPTVSHHLSKLSEAGLVSAKAEGYYSVYQLEESALEQARLLFSKQDLSNAVSDMDMGAYDRKIIRDFSLPDGRLKTIPAQRKKLEAVLRYIVQAFQTDRRYSEKEVNEILSGFHPDTATLRRELIGAGLMQREGGGGEYWRI